MKEQILKLREEGKTYDQIASILKCSKSTISYHCNNDVKNRVILRQNMNRKNKKQALINYKGGKCFICGYNKCNSALEFHHKDPNEKDFTLSNHYGKTVEDIKKELDKCDLLCSNCHREVHEKMLE